jgi:hypothetical protein
LIAWEPRDDDRRGGGLSGRARDQRDAGDHPLEGVVSWWKPEHLFGPEDRLERWDWLEWCLLVLVSVVFTALALIIGMLVFFLYMVGRFLVA